jgi:hypothetical protein
MNMVIQFEAWVFNIFYRKQFWFNQCKIFNEYERLVPNQDQEKLDSCRSVIVFQDRNKQQLLSRVLIMGE